MSDTRRPRAETPTRRHECEGGAPGFRRLVRAASAAAATQPATRRRRTPSLAVCAAAGSVAALVAASAPALAAPTGTSSGFSATGSLAVARAHAAVALLGDNEVLVAGGQDGSGNPLASAELYDPSTGTWHATGSMPLALSHSTATVLADGDVLLAGGLTVSSGHVVPTGDSLLYHVATGTWAFTKGGLTTASFDAGAALSAGGTVLYAGGLTATGASGTATATTEVFNPASDTWSNGPALPLAVAGEVVAPLSGSQVLVAGGETGASGELSVLAEVYSPSNSAFAAVQRIPVAVADAATTVLPSGEVLVAGGETSTGGAPSAASELFHPGNATWTSTGSLPFASYGATAGLLSGGSVLYAGGMTSGSGQPSAASALYDPTHATWTSTANLLAARGFAAGAALRNGDVLVAGGQTSAGVTGESELYSPVTTKAPAITSAATVHLVAGQYAKVTITATGNPVPQLSESGALPPGLSFSPAGNGTAVLSGTPSMSVAASYQLTITATNGVGTPAVQHLVVDFGRVPTITSPATASLVAGRAQSFTITSSGMPTPQLSVSGSLPPGLGVSYRNNGTAIVSGTVPSYDHGSWTLTVLANNGIGQAAVQHLVLAVSTPVAARITSPASFGLQSGTAVRLAVTSTGTPVPTLTEYGTLPPGLGFRPTGNGTATISGTIATGVRGTFEVTIVAANGSGSPAVQHLAIVVTVPTIAAGAGYWYVTWHNQLVTQGSARAMPSNNPQYPSEIVAIAPTPDGFGYYLASAFGGVFPYGDARMLGSVEHLHLRSPVVAMAVTPSGGGYYLVTAKGNVFHFGDAAFYGSPAHRRIAPVVAAGVTPDGHGYWLVTRTGAVYAYGDAGSYGWAPAHWHVVAFAPTPDGHGYWMATYAGAVLNFGDAGAYGSLVGHRSPPIAAFAATADGHGYWLVSKRGNVYNFGDARFYGSSSHTRLDGPVTGFAPQFVA